MFRNLAAELVRKGMRSKDLSLIIGVSPKTVQNKLNGVTEFTLPEIETILKTFPDCDYSYLFARGNVVTTQGNSQQNRRPAV